MSPRVLALAVTLAAASAMSACSYGDQGTSGPNFAHPSTKPEGTPEDPPGGGGGGGTPGGGTPTPFPLPVGCVEGFEDECFYFRILAEDEAIALRTGALPIRESYDAHRAEIVAGLDAETATSPFFGIDESGLELVFATNVAYELSQYRDRSSFDVPAGIDREALLADGVALVCNEYVSLAILLFYELSPQGPASPVQLHSVGWRRDSLVGNHAQLFTTGTGVPLLLDPTFGFVARGELAGLLLGDKFRAATPIVRRVQHQYTQPKLRNIFEQHLYPAGFQLETPAGLRPGLLIYSWLARDEGQGGPVVGYGAPDFVRELAPGPGDTFYAVTTGDVLQRFTRDGVEFVPGTWRSAIGRVDDATALLAGDGALTLETTTASSLVATGVRAIAGGPGRASVHALQEGGDLLGLASDVPVTIANDVVAIGEGRAGAAAYRLGEDGMLREQTASATTIVAQSQGSLVRGRGSLSAGRSAFALSEDGMLTRFASNGTPVTLATGIQDFAAGLGGFRLTVLTNDGRVLQGELAASGGVSTWVEPVWYDGPSTAPFVAISLDTYELLVIATQADGETRFASSSTF